MFIDITKNEYVNTDILGTICYRRLDNGQYLVYGEVKVSEFTLECKSTYEFHTFDNEESALTYLHMITNLINSRMYNGSHLPSSQENPHSQTPSFSNETRTKYAASSSSSSYDNSFISYGTGLGVGIALSNMWD